MKPNLRKLFGAAALIALVALPSPAAIESLDLPTMLSRVDNAVQGKIVATHVFRVDHPTEGRMFFTTITVKGTSLIDGKALQVPITFLGGYVSKTEGTRVSEMPAEQVTARGKTIVAFYKSCNDMGYGVSGNALYAAHGGVYSIVEKGAKQIVLGRGPGYALANNENVAALRTRVGDLATELAAQGKQFK